MEKEELHNWDRKFKTIVYLKGQLRSRNNDISTLTRYDKNDSHKQAILNAIKYRDDAKKAFVDSCEGFKYEYIMASIRQGKYLLSKTQLKNTTQSWIDKFENFNPFNNQK